MFSRLLQLRALVSALLLLVQVLGLGHLAFGRHALSEDGTLVDAAPLATEPHEGAPEHLCAGDVALHAAAPDCPVLAGWSAASLVTAPVAGRAQQPVVTAPKNPSFVAAQLDALSRAPKASPPQG